MASETHELVQRFVGARRDPARVVLEGYHAIKHALRFGAVLDEVVMLDGTPVDALPPELVEAGWEPDPVDEEVFDRLVPSRPPLPVVALAARPSISFRQVLDGAGAAPVVLLERPTHLGNLGAAVRVAAAAGAAGLLSIGRADPWSPGALRGGAGLQFALPVARADALPETDRAVVAFDADGDDLRGLAFDPRSVLAFGTERRGVSDDLLTRADRVVAIPMRPGVSSLNLATAVAIALYATGLAHPD